ncbi:hypothetical protein KUCAC02_000069, partial [Chaenocephalus aceratus]
EKQTPTIGPLQSAQVARALCSSSLLLMTGRKPHCCFLHDGIFIMGPTASIAKPVRLMVVHQHQAPPPPFVTSRPHNLEPFQ